MWLRTALRRALFPASVILPVWLMAGAGVFSSRALVAVGVTFAAPVLFFALVVVSVLVRLRGSVRRTGAVSWADAAIMSAWWLAIVLCVLPLPGAGWYGLAVIVLGLGAFWHAAWRLWRETREQLAGVRWGGFRGAPAAEERASGLGGGEHPVIVVEEDGGSGERAR